MENKFSEVMSKRTDSELIEIVAKFENDYQPDAVKAARIEISKRNLSTAQIENAKEEIRINELSQQAKEDESLEIGQKIMFFIFFWGIIPWAIAGTFKANGYSRKYKDAWKFMKYGFLGFICFNGLIFLIAYLTL